MQVGIATKLGRGRGQQQLQNTPCSYQELSMDFNSKRCKTLMGKVQKKKNLS